MQAGPFVLIIFGATGDLARSKLLPALFTLHKEKKLPEKFYVVGFARRDLGDAGFRDLAKEILGTRTGFDDFVQHLYYEAGKFDQKEGYEKLIEKLNGFDKEIGACVTRIFYLATPPDHYENILNLLFETKLSEGCGQGSNKWTRLAIEKPFGKDLETARSLDKRLSEIFEEKQIFRVDHYLGKETVQNMIAFRFANSIFDPLWNNQYIDHVQITFAEKDGVSNRGQFFDGVGMLRDVGQNHLMQLVAAVAMEQPKHFSKEPIREARAHAIAAIKHIEPVDVPTSVVRGQYEGYRAEKEVNPNSDTETFIAMKFFIDTPRLQNIPFYVRAGKKMAENLVEINIVFKQTCHILFKEYGCPEEGNILKIRIQPSEGIGMRVIAKKPGDKLALGTVDMKFSYHEEFGGKGSDAYEKVLRDIFLSDQVLFNRSDELESSWEFITKILEGWSRKASDKLQVLSYKSGTWGPKEADELIEKDGRKWL